MEQPKRITLRVETGDPGVLVNRTTYSLNSTELKR